MNCSTESARFFALQGGRCKIAAGVAKVTLRTILCLTTPQAEKLAARMQRHFVRRSKEKLLQFCPFQGTICPNEEMD